jgi:hypothetical protein
MTPNVAKQVEALRKMTVAELREMYAEVLGEDRRPKASGNPTLNSSVGPVSVSARGLGW